MKGGRRVPPTVQKIEDWKTVASRFLKETGIQVGVPAVGEVTSSTAPILEVDFSDGKQWKGRDPVLQGLLDRDREAIVQLKSLLTDYVMSLQGNSKLAGQRASTVDQERLEAEREAVRLIDTMIELAGNVMAAPAAYGMLTLPERTAIEVVYGMEPKGSQSTGQRGRPPERHVAALWMLVAILGALASRDGNPLDDKNMARLVMLVCPALLRVGLERVYTLVRQHRRALRLLVVSSRSRSTVMVRHPVRSPPDAKDLDMLYWMWPGFEFVILPDKKIPAMWRRDYRKKGSSGRARSDSKTIVL